MNDKSSYVRGTLVAALSAIALVGTMFLEWFSVTLIRPGEEGGPSLTESGGAFSAWQAFSITDIVLAVLVAVVLIVPLLSAVGVRLYRYGPGPILAGAAVIAVALVASQLLAPPSRFEVGENQFGKQQVSRSLGGFVGLLATIGMAAGGTLAAMPALRERAAARDAADAAATR